MVEVPALNVALGLNLKFPPTVMEDVLALKVPVVMVRD